jgi:hypothetical protein
MLIQRPYEILNDSARQSQNGQQHKRDSCLVVWGRRSMGRMNIKNVL